MDKQKQIQTEELIGIIQGAVGGCATHWASLIAEEVLKYYQPKIPEGAVVLTEEELHDKGYRNVCEPVIRNGEVVGFVNGADYVPKNLFLFGVANTRKETAEKFAEMLKARYMPPINKWDEISIGCLFYDIDEICKEISEGKEDVKNE